jgi:leader peptidase (prepilin peptidase)/N-methyltransferase
MTEPVTPDAFIWILVILLGLIIGSFTNVLIWRLPRGESIRLPRSHCPSCGHPLCWYHNIPLFSWLFLRGRCAFCHRPIAWVYPAVELACAALFAAFYARYGVSWTTLGFWYLSATLVAVFVIDLRHRIIPNALTYPGVIVGVAISLLSRHLHWWQSLMGAAVGIAVFVGIALLGWALFRRDSLGGGDIKLAAVLGAFLGAGKILLVFVLSAAIGLAVSLVALLIVPRLRRDRLIPFGPFLATAAVVTAFYGEALVRYYVEHFLS